MIPLPIAAQFEKRCFTLTVAYDCSFKNKRDTGGQKDSARPAGLEVRYMRVKSTHSGTKKHMLRSLSRKRKYPGYLMPLM